MNRFSDIFLSFYAPGASCKKAQGYLGREQYLNSARKDLAKQLVASFPLQGKKGLGGKKKKEKKVASLAYHMDNRLSDFFSFSFWNVQGQPFGEPLLWQIYWFRI